MKSLYIGIELGDNQAQISYFEKGMKSPVSVSFSEDSNVYVTPFLLEERDEQIPIKLFARLFKILEKQVGSYETSRVVVTLRTIDYVLIENARKALFELGISSSDLEILVREDAFAYYVLNESSISFVNDAVVFDVSDNQIFVARVRINKARKPYAVRVVNEVINIETGGPTIDEQLVEIAGAIGHLEKADAVYFTGEGLKDQKLNGIYAYVVGKTRAFKGMNIYAIGACACAVGAAENYYEDYRLITDKRTKLDISVIAEENHKTVRKLLLKAGEKVKDENEMAEYYFFTGGRQKITFSILSQMSNELSEEVIDISEIPVRDRKTARVRIRVFYETREKLVIEIEDLGFGEFFRSSGVVIRKAYNISAFI